MNAATKKVRAEFVSELVTAALAEGYGEEQCKERGWFAGFACGVLERLNLSRSVPLELKAIKVEPDKTWVLTIKNLSNRPTTVGELTIQIGRRLPEGCRLSIIDADAS